MKAATESILRQDAELLVLDGSLPCECLLLAFLTKFSLKTWTDYSIYETGDGKYITVGALEPRFYGTFM